MGRWVRMGCGIKEERGRKMRRDRMENGIGRRNGIKMGCAMEGEVE